MAFQFSFSGDAQGLTDDAGDAAILWAYNGGEGNPAGCMQCDFTDSLIIVGVHSDSCTQTNTLKWTDLGVPADAVQVLSVVATADYKTFANPVGIAITDSFSVDIVDVGGSSILSAPLINAQAFDAATGGWATSSGAVATVTANKTPGSIARLKLSYTGNVTIAVVGVRSVQVDNVNLTITYVPGATEAIYPDQFRKVQSAIAY